MRSVRAFVLLLCCSGCWCEECNMTQTYFNSHNFFTVLHWDKIEIPGQEVRYSVNYCKYGVHLAPFIRCQNITEPYCDLSDVFNEFRSRYLAKIMVGNICVGQYRNFVPLQETILEAPRVSVIQGESFIAVTLTEPTGPRNLPFSKEFGTDSINYIIHLTHPESEAGKDYQNTSGTLFINHLQSNTKYCGVARYQLTHPSTQKLSQPATFCVALPKTPIKASFFSPSKGGLWIYFVVLGPAVLVVIVLGVILCQLYLRRKNNLPKVLTQITSKMNSPNFPTFPDPKIDVLRVYAEAPRDLVRTTPDLFSVLGKSNRISCVSQDCSKQGKQGWNCHSYMNQELQDPELQVQSGDRSSESCTSYSMVVGVLKSFSSDSGLSESMSPGLDSCPGDDCDVFKDFCNVNPDREHVKAQTEAYANGEVLRLPVSRSTNGKLLFTDLLFEPLLPSITEADQPPVMASTPAGEKIPCLSGQDSGWQDHPGYGRTYLPNNVPEIPKTDPIPGVTLSDCVSNYRQNWVPEIFPGIPQKDRNCMMSSESLIHEVEEVDSGFGPLILDGWMVQIQG